VLFEVLIAVVIKIPVLCALMPWWLVNNCQSSGDVHTTVCAVSRQKRGGDKCPWQLWVFWLSHWCSVVSILLRCGVMSQGDWCLMSRQQHGLIFGHLTLAEDTIM